MQSPRLGEEITPAFIWLLIFQGQTEMISSVLILHETHACAQKQTHSFMPQKASEKQQYRNHHMR